MRLNVNHYFSKNPDLPTTFGIEAILTGLFTGVLAGFFAFMGYHYGILGILVFCTGACIVCTIATMISIYEFIRNKRFNKECKIKDTDIDDIQNQTSRDLDQRFCL